MLSLAMRRFTKGRRFGLVVEVGFPSVVEDGGGLEVEVLSGSAIGKTGERKVSS